MSSETVNIVHIGDRFQKDNKKSPAPRSTKSSRGREQYARTKKSEHEQDQPIPPMATILTKIGKGKSMIQQQSHSLSPVVVKSSNAIHAKSCKNLIPLPANKYSSIKNIDIDICKVVNTEQPSVDNMNVNQLKSEIANAKLRINQLEKNVADLELQLTETANKLEVSESTTSYLEKKIEEIQDTYFNKWFTVSTQICDTEKKFNKTVIEYESKLVEKKILNERLEKDVDALQEKIDNLEKKYYIDNNSILFGQSMSDIENIVSEKDNDIARLNKRIDYLEKKLRSMKIEARVQRIEARKQNVEPLVSKSNENNCYRNETKFEGYKMTPQNILYENEMDKLGKFDSEISGVSG